jgi:hypothetical protein
VTTQAGTRSTACHFVVNRDAVERVLARQGI